MQARLTLSILGAAALLGLLADALLRATPWGINLSIWIVFLVAGILVAKSSGGGSLQIGSIALMAPMLLFGFCFAWRDSGTLRGLDLMAILLAAALVITKQSAPFWAPTLGRVFQSVFNLAGHCAAGFVHLIARDIDWSAQRNSVIAANARSATVGVLLALPLLVIFTALFVRADAAFESFYQDILHIRIAQHLFPIALGAWISGSYMRGVLVPSIDADPGVKAPRFEIGVTELNVVLGLLNALFATFVAVQTQYLFGTSQMIETTPGLTFASYARRGFFELCTVALMVLPILLAGDKWHTQKGSKRLYRIQSALLVAFVLCIMASALHRMRLYQVTYGLTELRWYTVAFMIWLAFVFLFFCVTVLRDAKGLFTVGVVASSFAAIFILHALNPDERIAAANIANARAGRRFDPEYFRLLSADALPIVLANSDVLKPQELKAYLAPYEQMLQSPLDIRSWNYGRASAFEALKKAGQ